MPPTAPKSKSTLGIRLENNQSAFYPGDTIIGYVYRESLIGVADPFVNISLHGRAKARDPVDEGEEVVVYRSRLDLIDHKDATQRLQGTVQASQGKETGYKWYFALNIPTYVNGSFLREREGKDAYIPIRPGGGDVLPPSFNAGEKDDKSQAFVEYFIQADLPVQGKSIVSRTASLPIQILNLYPQPAITFNVPEAQHHQLQAASWRLIPGMEVVKLSFSQRLKKSFAPKDDPRFSFNLEVHLPTIIQLGSTTPIPLLMQATPIWNQTDEIIQNVPQRVKIITLGVNVYSTTRVKCEDCHDGKWEICSPLYVRLPANPPMELVCGGEETFLVDVGEIVNLKTSTHDRFGTRVPPIQLDYVTYNIWHGHRIEYNMEVTVGGKSMRVQGDNEVTVLPHGQSGRTEDGAFEAPPPPWEPEGAGGAIPGLPPAYMPRES